MDLRSLGRHFERIGAELELETIAVGASSRKMTPRQRLALNSGYALDVIEERRNERYALILREDEAPQLEFVPLDVQPNLRHLLLMVRKVDEDGVAVGTQKSKFLCGHDERHWFVAVPDNSVSLVTEAMEALKPVGLARMQHRIGVRSKDWNRRKNAAFLRQGEWFFLPRPDFSPPANAVVLQDEAIRRGDGGKPHMVENLMRFGGEEIWVCPQRPNGLTPPQYRKLLSQNPDATGWSWRVMRRNMAVYARGKVRHADHATILLPFWHQVVMNTESIVTASGRVSNNVAFID